MLGITALLSLSVSLLLSLYHATLSLSTRKSQGLTDLENHLLALLAWQLHMSELTNASLALPYLIRRMLIVDC